jgi:hypothetical protein
MAPTLGAGVRELPSGGASVTVASGEARPGDFDAQPLLVSADRSIDWSGTFDQPAKKKDKAGDAPAQPAWLGDFVNHLARSETQRNPNLGIRVHVETGSRLSTTSGRG